METALDAAAAGPGAHLAGHVPIQRMTRTEFGTAVNDRHNGHPLPTILVGGANGKHRGGRHLELGEPTPIANLH